MGRLSSGFIVVFPFLSSDFLEHNSDTKRDPPGLERCLQFVAFFFGLRSHCQKARQKNKFPFAALVHNPSALRSLCGHVQSYSIARLVNAQPS